MNLRISDVSGWQPGHLNLAGLNGAVSKATEGTGMVSAAYAPQIAQIRAELACAGSYHFASGLDPVAEARHYTATAGHRPGEVLAQDLEPAFFAAVTDPVGWAVAFHREVRRLTGANPLAYITYANRLQHDWRPLVAEGAGLWTPEYNNVGPASPAPWPFVAMWQNSDRSTTGGDSDVFFGDVAAWHRYGGATGAPAGPAAPAPRPVPRPAPVYSATYTVRRGDSLSAIAARFGVSVAALAAWNRIPDVNRIYPGQTLTIRTPAPRPVVNTPAPRTVTVRAGDTLSAIAARTGSTVAALVALNRIPNPDLIQPGQVFRY